MACERPVIYKGTGRLDSVHVGIWVDFDLGCPYDDYVGSNQAAGFFAYNQDAIDGESGSDCSGITTFEDQIPVQSVTFLNHHIDKMMALHFPGLFWSSDPVEPYEYYNYLTGTFREGTAPTEGGIGYNPSNSAAPINYMFPGDPANANTWSMCSVNPLIGDVAAIGSVKIDSLLPGIVTEMVLAWTVHPNPSLPCNVGSMYSDVALLRGLNAWNYSNICSVSSKASEPAPDTLELFPNPAMNQFTLVYGNMKISELRLYAADGRWVRTLQNLPSEKVVVPVQDLTSGMYEMQLITDQGNFIRKLSIAR